jgi:hypothetical protein
MIAMKVLFEHLLKRKKLRNPSEFFYPSLKGHARAIRGRDELATTVLTAPSIIKFNEWIRSNCGLHTFLYPSESILLIF